LPAVNAYTPYGLLNFCPEYGLVSLFGTPSGGKYGGKWLGSVDSGKYFNTNKNPGIYPVIYQFKSDKGCINSDTLFFSIVLPEIHIDKSDLAICTHENASLASSIKSAHKMLWSINSSSDGYFHNSLNNPQNTYQPGNKDKFNKGFWIYAQTVDTVCKAAYDSAYFNINAVPKPDFISHTVEGQNPLTVKFIDSSKIEYGNISNWSWDFGDGNTSTLRNPVHQYTTSGKFDVKLKVVGDSLCSDSIRKNAMIYVWPLSLNEEGNVKLMVYPNPANNQLIVKVQSQGITITHFVLCNFIGAKVMELNNINMSQAIIDRKHLAAGLYFLKVDDSAGNRHVFQVVFE
jgi:PKD repeat protein